MAQLCFDVRARKLSLKQLHLFMFKCSFLCLYKEMNQRNIAVHLVPLCTKLPCAAQKERAISESRGVYAPLGCSAESLFRSLLRCSAA